MITVIEIKRHTRELTVAGENEMVFLEEEPYFNVKYVINVDGQKMESQTTIKRETISFDEAKAVILERLEHALKKENKKISHHEAELSGEIYD